MHLGYLKSKTSFGQKRQTAWLLPYQQIGTDTNSSRHPYHWRLRGGKSLYNQGGGLNWLIHASYKKSGKVRRPGRPGTTPQQITQRRQCHFEPVSYDQISQGTWQSQTEKFTLLYELPVHRIGKMVGCAVTPIPTRFSRSTYIPTTG